MFKIFFKSESAHGPGVSCSYPEREAGEILAKCSGGCFGAGLESEDQHLIFCPEREVGEMLAKFSGASFGDNGKGWPLRNLCQQW